MKLRKSHIAIAFIVVFGTLIVGYAAWSGYRVHKATAERTQLKIEYAAVNDIYYGLLSVDAWEDQLRQIVENQIKDFEFSPEQLNTFRSEIDLVIQNVITRAEDMIDKDDKGWKGKLRKIAVQTFVDMDKLRRQVPGFTNEILHTLTRPENMNKLRGMAISKLDEFADETHGETVSRELNAVYEQYGVSSKAEFNSSIQEYSTQLYAQAYMHGRNIIICTVLFALLWFFVRNRSVQFSVYLVFATLLAMVVLAVGVTTPMLEIDARITSLQFILMGETVSFEEQMIFYQSKSILDVVWLLLESKPLDSIVVGVLILAFSVLLPSLKLVSFIIFLISKKVQNWFVMRWIAFYSGKWSMADVMVVAIFMSYVAFDGIIHNQLRHINKDTEAVKALATNNTALQAGFIVFVTYVVYSMLLSEMLKWKVRKSHNDNGAPATTTPE